MCVRASASACGKERAKGKKQWKREFKKEREMGAKMIMCVW